MNNPGMTYLLALLLASVIGGIAWWWRRQRVRNRLKEIDDGRRCIGCGSKNMTVTEHSARCNDCMYTADLAVMRAAKVSEQDIANLTYRKR